MNRKLKKIQEKQEKAKDKAKEKATRIVNQGVELQLADDLEGALRLYESALKTFPNHPGALNCMGVVELKKGNAEKAIELTKRSIEVDPYNSRGHCNLGVAYDQLKQYDKSIKHFKAAISLEPGNASFYTNLGYTYERCNRLTDAIATYRQALKINNNNPLLWGNLGNILSKLDLNRAIKAYQMSLNLTPNAAVHSNLVLCINYSKDFTNQEILEEAKNYARNYAPESNILKLPESLSERNLDPDRKLNIGYVSGDFKKHPVMFFLRNVLKAHDRNRFGIFCYSSNTHRDEYTEEIESLVDEFTVLANMPVAEAAKKIAEDRIDILIDLSGHTGLNMLPLFGYKPAPVQAGWIGYVGTTGLSQMDYYICDKYLAYEGMEKDMTEKPLILQSRVCPFETPGSEGIEPNQTPALKPESGSIIFGCFNNPSKVTEEVIELWSKILLQVPNSMILLKSRNFSEAITQNNYIELFAKHGIYKERIIFEGHSADREEYYKSYHKIDIALDPFPYNGGTTTIDTIWMGVPVITLAGSKMVSRVGVTILGGAGLDEFIAESKEEYTEKAVNLTKDLNKLNETRLTMREKIKNSDLFNAEKITRDFEDSLRKVWNEYIKSQTV